MSVAELVEFNDDGEARVECVCTAGRETSEIEVGKEPGEVEALFCVCEKFLQKHLDSDISQII